MKQTEISLDIIRIVASCLVVFMHSPIPSANGNSVLLLGISYFTLLCIGLLFMVSGGLLLLVKLDYFTFFKLRLSKIVVPILIWTGVYLSLNIYFS